MCIRVGASPSAVYLTLDGLLVVRTAPGAQHMDMPQRMPPKSRQTNQPHCSNSMLRPLQSQLHVTVCLIHTFDAHAWSMDTVLPNAAPCRLCPNTDVYKFVNVLRIHACAVCQK